MADRGPEVSGGDNVAISHPAQAPNATLITSDIDWLHPVSDGRHTGYGG